MAILYAGEDRLQYARALVDAGADVDHVDAFHETPIMTVIKRGEVSVKH